MINQVSLKTICPECSAMNERNININRRSVTATCIKCAKTSVFNISYSTQSAANQTAIFITATPIIESPEISKAVSVLEERNFAPLPK